MSVPPDMKTFNQQLIAEFRANRGKLSGQLSGSRVLLLTTKGAKSGVERTVVIGYREYGETYAVIASNNGAPQPPHWYGNLMADPTATVEVGPDTFRVRARVAAGVERSEAAQLIDYLEGQQAKVQREIPILLLERL
jgi:deazaflavin-dependent oxidoreductase (nitroreductase family)